VLALSYGLPLGEWAPCAVRDESASRERAAAVLAGIAVATITPGPIRFAYFDTPLGALRSHASSESQPVFPAPMTKAISHPRSGRRAVRRFSGVVRLVSYDGFGSSQLVLERLGTFAINVATIAIWRRSLTAHAS